MTKRSRTHWLSRQRGICTGYNQRDELGIRTFPSLVHCAEYSLLQVNIFPFTCDRFFVQQQLKSCVTHPTQGPLTCANNQNKKNETQKYSLDALTNDTLMSNPSKLCERASLGDFF